MGQKIRVVCCFIFIILLTCLMTGCKKKVHIIPASPEERQGMPLDRLYGRWPNPSATPVTPLVVSNDFTSSEQDLMSDMANEWTSAAEFRFNFFNLPLSAVVGKRQTDNYNDLDNYYDDEMGIYKSSDWFPSVSSYAIAITQFFGYRRNVGTAHEYIELDHADIIVNYRDFNFSNDLSPGTYDLTSIILHEMGHFLGLPHADYGATSVMIPSIPSVTEKRIPFAKDNLAILYNYGVLNDASAKYAASPNRSNSHSQEGEFVVGRMELRANGECIHYISAVKKGH